MQKSCKESILRKTEKKKGRPKKNLPGGHIEQNVLKKSGAEVRKIAKEYSSGELRGMVRYIQEERPRLLKKAGILDNLSYNRARVSLMPEKDQMLIADYITARKKICFLNQAVSGIPEEQLRDIAEDTLLKGKRCIDLEEKYELPERTLRWKKRRALEYMSELYLYQKKDI